MRTKSRLRRTISKWANPDEAEARDLRKTFSGDGVICIGDAPDREPVRLRGTLRTVTLRPRGGVPALEAELYDGTGTVTVIWLGRRRIAGIGPGRALEVQGRVSIQDGHRTLYNPRYELL
ncbi:OB-fold nucleic acid binding domain-containing protein [Nocardioides carbamazepini]|uniref:OB-fold nucleic acid binding domain-containing protein n=1 Tax=Nocardioides carbamazepini TaxID=2854259 RepID=UPI002149D0FB|nr:OB-fold nucleic acid binding domain-containing protein [Nocardioides carbamazepini]MCR1781514.1 OB-fold nucleic acid binding domain-containing protein [Nocardioides carbamazepini]